MLGALENLLLPSLKQALGASQDIQTGPALAPEGKTSRVALHATQLAGDPSGDDDEATRDPAFRGWQGTLSATADHPQDFLLPDAASGEVVEVQSPPGRILAPGDAYLQEGRTLHFLTRPTGPVIARCRGETTAGYRERRRSRIDLELRVWAKDAATLDGLMARSLAAMLTPLESCNVIDLAGAPPSLGLRLCKPQLSLDTIQRSLDPAAPQWLLGLVRCTLRGELELSLSLGAPEAQGLIRQVDIQLQRPPKPA